MRLALSSLFLFTLVTMIQSTRYRMENCQDKKDNNNDKCKIAGGQVDQNNSGCGDTKMKVLVPSTSLRILQQRQDDEYGRCGESTYNFHREVWE